MSPQTEQEQAAPARLRALAQLLRDGVPAGWRSAGGGGPAVEVLARALERLERDLLPRTAGTHEHLVVGVVGPNNAGKSALFNGLVAGAAARGAPAPERISPSRPTGGATRRLVGAAHPDLVELLAAEPTLQSFAMTRAEQGFDPTEDAPPGRAHELLLTPASTLPSSLLLVDTPDFDSVFLRNREVTDALLTVCDLALVVVTRHTYQNHDVVEFLRAWLASGRPWVLVYNESVDAATTAAHASKIAADIETPPEAVFHAPFDGAIAEGSAALVPMALEQGSPGAREVTGPLSTWLRDLGASEDLKRRALASSMAALDADLADLRRAATAEVAGADEFEAALRRFGEPLGRAVAREAMPMGPFLEAFREVLDERPTLLQRELRKGLRWTGAKLAKGARALRSLVGVDGGPVAGGSADVESTLLDAERAQLDARWAEHSEPALRALRQRVREGAFPPMTAQAIEPLVLGPPNVHGARARAEERLALDPEVLREYRVACRELIAAELDAGRSEWALQLAVDGLHLLPLGVAGAVIVQTGGLGADLAVAGGGAVSAALAERLSRLLGTGVATAARERWIQLRSARIGEAAAEGLGGEELRSLRALADAHRSFLRSLEGVGGDAESREDRSPGA